MKSREFVKCQCGWNSLDHEPHNCPNRAEWMVTREENGVNKRIAVCRECLLSRDVEEERITYDD